MRGIGKTRSRALDAATRGVAHLRRARPVPLLAALCAVQLAITAWFAFATPHNGFVWYSGGDASEYWTAQWAVGHLRLTQTFIGWGLPVLYAWVPLVTGTTLLSGLPVIVVFQAVVLVPLTVVLIWLVADRLFGRLYAWGATALWVAAPVLLVWGMRRHDYRAEFEQNFLAPHVYGLTNMADFPSVVLTLACAWATLRALDSDRTEDWVFAGLLAGVTLGVKPANSFFLVGVIVVLALSRRARGALVFAGALVPALVVLAIWKQRGLGHLPLLAAGQVHEAAGPLVAASPTRYVPWDFHHLGSELRDLMEEFWSVRLLEWIALAGTVAAIRRAPARGAFVVVWFAMFCVVKGSSNQASVTTTSYFRLTEPGFPAFVLLAAALAYLVPLGRTRTEGLTPRPIPRWVVALTAVVGAVVPLVLVVAIRPQPSSASTARDLAHATEAPISDALAAAASGGTLSWRPVDGHGARVQYIVYRVDPSTGGCAPLTSGAPECLFSGTAVGMTRATSLDVQAGASYRVAAAANYLDEENGSDLMLLGPPVTVP
ncbi:MAG TPA: glycosyltransferase family 39 protein [Gaiellaceae bacterium]